MGDVDQVGEAEVLHLPGRVPIARIVPFSIEAILGDPQVEILRCHARVDVDGRALVVTRNIEGPVVHDVVEIDTDPEAVRGGDEGQQLCLGAIAGAHAAPLILTAEVKWIPKVVSDG